MSLNSARSLGIQLTSLTYSARFSITLNSAEHEIDDYICVQVCDSVDDCPKGKRDEQEVICQGSPFTRYLYSVIFSMPFHFCV